MLYFLYVLITDLAGPPLRVWLRGRARRGKEIRERLPERMGRASRPRPDGKLAWFHGASVGECLSLLPLIEAVTARGWQVMVTSGTVTSAAMLAERLPAHSSDPQAFHQFIPLDRRAWVNAFLAHWRPDLVIWAESELWPNTLSAVGARRIPAVLVNARLSDRAFRGWRRWPGFARATLGAFRMILAQSELDRARFAALGASDVRVTGNLKLAAAPLPADDNALAALRALLGDRPRWLAASIHPGEDAVVAHVHRMLRDKHPGLLTIVVPRHPQRGPEMTAVFTGQGLAVARRGAGGTPAGAEIYLADTMGELGLFFRATDLVFMGKSLAVGGGQNPAEPARLGAAVLFGPDMSNFRDTAALLATEGGALQVKDSGELVRVLDALLGDAPRRARMGAAARAGVIRHGDALAETLRPLDPYLSGTQIR